MGVLRDVIPDVLPFETKAGREAAKEFANNRGFHAVREPTHNEVYGLFANGVLVLHLIVKYFDKRTGEEIPPSAHRTLRGLEEEGNLEVSLETMEPVH